VIVFPDDSVSNPAAHPRNPLPTAYAHISRAGGRVDFQTYMWHRLIPSMPVDDSPQLRIQGYANAGSLLADSQFDAPLVGEINYYRRGVITPEATCTSQSHRVVLTRLAQ
jgi:hypothetical protein